MECYLHPREHREALASLRVSPVMPTSREEELVAILEAFAAAHHTQDVEAVLALVTDDVVYREGPAPFAAVSEGKQHLQSILLELFPSFRIERIWDYKVEGNVLTFQARYSADHIRKHYGIEAFESNIEVTFEGDKIKSWNNTFSPDTIEKLWAALG